MPSTVTLLSSTHLQVNMKLNLQSVAELCKAQISSKWARLELGNMESITDAIFCQPIWLNINTEILPC